ncbi:hypothetical protein KVT40_000356 [Elsinoe batatas]|uniref:C2H2-type domain-containing protein n=1 Tax=Elsinoe batatas TaxID=2601811 RepID=A0A8K0PIJ9_9PEZI|nr:hypothetical protein KVT40_000356 [Elsinoe batatas]
MSSICPVCNTQHGDVDTMVAHIMQEHDANRPFFCTVCPRHFSTAAARNKHEAEHAQSSSSSSSSSSGGSSASSGLSPLRTTPERQPGFMGMTRAEALAEVLSRTAPALPPNRGLIPHHTHSPQRDALDAAARTLVDIYGFPHVLRVQDLDQHIATLDEALLQVREDPMIRTMPAFLDRLARLHGRWIKLRQLLLTQLGHDFHSTRGDIRDIMVELSAIARDLDFNKNDVDDEADDLQQYEFTLYTIYFFRIIFLDMPEIDTGNAGVAETLADAAPGAAQYAGENQMDEQGEIDPDPFAWALVHQAVAEPAADLMPTLTAPVRPQLPDRMDTFGDLEPVRFRVRPANPTTVTDQRDPLTAGMLQSLLAALPRGQYEQFRNQRECMNVLYRADGLLLYVPYTNEPFACDACRIGFPDLEHFLRHMHGDHMVGPTLHCLCGVCTTVFSGQYDRVQAALNELYQRWLAIDPLALEKGTDGVENMAGALFAEPDGGVAPGFRDRLFEQLQDTALSGLWGINTNSFGRAPRQ